MCHSTSTMGRFHQYVDHTATLRPLLPPCRLPPSQLFDANVWGLLAVTQAVVPYMAAVRRGTVVNVGSVVGFFATPWAGVYRYVPNGARSPPNESSVAPPTPVAYPVVPCCT